MNETEKENAKAAIHETAGSIADKAGEAAKTATGWRKWVYLALAALAGGIAYFTAGCTTTVSQAADGSWQYSGVIVLPVEGGK